MIHETFIHLASAAATLAGAAVGITIGQTDVNMAFFMALPVTSAIAMFGMSLTNLYFYLKRRKP
ncbi:MAG: hypothetical protein ABW092_04000 [Candidatus Thiodiazotropha sp.]